MTINILGQTIYSDEENKVNETVETIYIGENTDKQDLIETDTNILKDKSMRIRSATSMLPLEEGYEYVSFISKYLIENNALDKIDILDNGRSNTLKDYVIFQSMIGGSSSTNVYATRLKLSTVGLKNRFSLTYDEARYIYAAAIRCKELHNTKVINNTKNYIITLTDVEVEVKVALRRFTPDDATKEKLDKIVEIIKQHLENNKYAMLQIYEKLDDKEYYRRICMR